MNQKITLNKINAREPALETVPWWDGAGEGKAEDAGGRQHQLLLGNRQLLPFSGSSMPNMAICRTCLSEE